MIGGASYYVKFKQNYERFRDLYNAEDTTYIPLETSKYYKNLYRRYRDYALLVTFAGYLLQVIDANVFAYMHDFEISEDISLKLSPSLIAPDPFSAPALGMGLCLTF